MIIAIYKQNGVYVVKPPVARLETNDTILFISSLSEKYRLRFDSKVCKRMDPNQSYDSSGGIVIDQAVRSNAQTDYTIELDTDSLNARIKVEEPPVLSRLAGFIIGLLAGASAATVVALLL